MMIITESDQPRLGYLDASNKKTTKKKNNSWADVGDQPYLLKAKKQKDIQQRQVVTTN